MSYTFIWDDNKNRKNIKKHNVSFEEASTIFSDPNVRYSPDTIHSVYEERTIAIGISNRLNLLLVCHCEYEAESLIRIISARKATKTETALYNGEHK